MKKWISFMMILFLAVIFVGCGDKPDKPNPKPNNPTEIKVTSIEVTGVKEELEEGESFTLEIKVLPENATNKNYRVAAVDTSVLKVEDKKVTALKGGETTLTVTPLGNTQLKKEFKITVKGKEAPIEIIKPETFTIGGKQEVEKGKTTALSITATPDKANKEATWSSSDESIATVNNGIVKGVELGEVTITATSTLNPLVKAEYKIKVVEAIDKPIIQPTSITLTGDEELEIGYSIRLVANILPAGADPSLIWESTKPEVATVDEKGVVKGLTEGTTYITAISAVKSDVKARLKIKVKVDQTTLIPIVNLQGYVIETMNAASAVSEIDPFHEEYRGDDKMYKQQAWREAESKYGCTFKVTAYPEDAGWGPSRVSWINSQAELGQGKADFYVIDPSWIPEFYSSGAMHATTTYFAKYGKNQMEPAIKQCATYKGELYAISTGLSASKIYIDQGLFYNYGLIEKYKLESPAKMFNEGRWSYDDFLQWCLAAQAVLDDKMWVLSGAPELYWSNMVQASGVKIADVGTLELNMLHTYSLDAVDILRQLVLGGTFDTNGIGYDEGVESFQNGKAIFQSASYWFVRASNRFPSDMWGEDTRFGYVPYPYHPSVGKERSRVNASGDSVLMMAGARDFNHPAGVKYEDIYRALQDMYLNTIKLQEQDPTYDSDKIKETAASSKLDDPESVQAVIFYTGDKTLFDPIYAGIETDYSSELTKALRNAVVKGEDFTSGINAIYNNIYSNMVSIYG